MTTNFLLSHAMPFCYKNTDASVIKLDGSSYPPKFYSTSRARRQLAFYFIIAILSISLAMGLGIPLVGRSYNINISHIYEVNASLADLMNGRFTSSSQLLGMYLQIYLGTLGLMLFGNFIPSFVVLQLPRSLYIAIIIALLLCFLIAMAMSMYFFIEPQKTFTSHINVGAGDPNLSTSGAFFFMGFSFLVGLCLGILRLQLLMGKDRGQMTNNIENNAHVPIDIGSEEHHHTSNSKHSLRFTKGWRLTKCKSSCMQNLFRQGRRRAAAFIIFYILLG